MFRRLENFRRKKLELEHWDFGKCEEVNWNGVKKRLELIKQNVYNLKLGKIKKLDEAFDFVDNFLNNSSEDNINYVIYKGTKFDRHYINIEKGDKKITLRFRYYS